MSTTFWRWLLGSMVLAVGLGGGSSFSAESVESDSSIDPVAAQQCWRRLAEVEASAWPDSELAEEAERRLLATSRGRQLVADLCELFPTAEESRQPMILVRFVDRLSSHSDGVDGLFSPLERAAPSYELLIQRRFREAAVEPAVFLFGEYPSNPECAYVYFYEEPASAMAQTLFHELLHVWYLNAEHEGRIEFPTGHGAVTECEFEIEFLTALRDHAGELTAFEGRTPRPREKVPAASIPSVVFRGRMSPRGDRRINRGR